MIKYFFKKKYKISFIDTAVSLLLIPLYTLQCYLIQHDKDPKVILYISLYMFAAVNITMLIIYIFYKSIDITGKTVCDSSVNNINKRTMMLKVIFILNAVILFIPYGKWRIVCNIIVLSIAVTFKLLVIDNIIIFTDDFYYSGFHKILLSDIEKISVKYVRINAVTFDIYFKNKFIGYDKFYNDSFDYLSGHVRECEK